MKKFAIKKFIPLFSKWKLAKMIAENRRSGGSSKTQKPVFFLSLLLSRWRNAPMTLLLSWIGLKLAGKSGPSAGEGPKHAAHEAKEKVRDLNAKGNLARFGFTGALVWLTAKFLGRGSLPSLLAASVLGLLWKSKPVKSALQAS